MSEHLKINLIDMYFVKLLVFSTEKPSTITSNMLVLEQNPFSTFAFADEDPSTITQNSDLLLDQAIQSLGVPSDIILGTGLLPDEPLTLLGNENFSTVNLRDLD